MLNLDAGVPFLLMTATCPPSLRSEILSSLGIIDCHVIHAATDRPEISYNVKLHPTLKQAEKELIKSVKEYLKAKEGDTSFRGLVYCRSKKQVERIAKSIGCTPFHAERPQGEREVNFREWVGGKQKFLVSTSLLGCGIDVEGVRAVFHFGTPWSILDFVQESGRAGRGGHPSTSVVFAGMDEDVPLGGDANDLYGKETMRNWVTQDSECRRSALSDFLDKGRKTCMLLKGAVLCDVCKAESLKHHPKKLVEFSTAPIPDGDIPKAKKLPYVPSLSLTYEIERNRSRESNR